eukprot:COSAG02_NODE_2041_length_10027_cov_21.142023_2_plen_72_part_00
MRKSTETMFCTCTVSTARPGRTSISLTIDPSQSEIGDRAGLSRTGRIDLIIRSTSRNFLPVLQASVHVRDV